MHVLAEINPLNTTTGLRDTLRVASSHDLDLTGFDGQRWLPVLHTLGPLEIELFDGDFSSAVAASQTSFALSVVALSELAPTVLPMRWQDAPVKLWVSGASGPVLRFVGTVTRFERSGNLIKLTAEPGGEAGETEVLNLSYAGTTGIEGDADLKGRLKPWLLGKCFNLEPFLINSVDNIYQVSAYGPIKAINVLYERAATMGASFGDYANYAALVAADVPHGRWATCLAQGLIKLGAPAFGVITVDAEGDYTDGTLADLTGAILQRVAGIRLIDVATIDTASLAALDAFAATLPSGGKVGIYLTEQIRFVELARRMCLPLNAQAGYSLLGKLQASRVKPPVEEDVTFRLDALGRELPIVSEMIEADTLPPYKKIIMGGARSWRVHTFDEIATAYNLIDRGRYSDTETYREGNIVSLADESRWLYENETATAGNDPVTGSAYWTVLSAAISIGDIGGIVTNRDPVPPESMPIGSFWIDPEGNRHYRVTGTEMSLPDGPILWGGGPLIIGGLVDVQDGDIDSALTTAGDAFEMADEAAFALATLADDGVITVTEKIQVLLPKDGLLEAAYQALFDAATAVGVPTTAATAARAAWVAYRDTLDPPWDDVTRPTAVSRTAFRTAILDYDTALEDLNKAVAERASYSLSLSPPSITLRADYLGVIPAESFPITVTPALLKGSVNANAGAAWSFSASGTISATQDTSSNTDSEGTVTISDVTGDGTLTITGDGLTISARISVARDAPPPAVTAPGGVTASSTLNANAAVSSSSFPSDPSHIALITAPAGGDVRFVGGWSHTKATTTITLAGKMVYRVAGSGGAWIDVAAATDGTPSMPSPEPEAGYWSQDNTIALTPSTDYEWGMMFRRSAGTGITTPYGATTAEQA